MKTLTIIEPAAHSGALLRLDEVSQRTCRGKTAIYADMKNASFPRPVRIGSRAVAWKAADIEAWISSRPAA